MDGTFSASENNTILWWGHIGWNAFRRCTNALRLVCLGNGGWGFAASKDDSLLGWYSARYGTGLRCVSQGSCLGSSSAALLGWRSAENRADSRPTLHRDCLGISSPTSEDYTILDRNTCRDTVLCMDRCAASVYFAVGM